MRNDHHHIGIGWLNWLQNKQNKYFFQKKKILLTIQNNHHFFSKSEWIKESKMNNNNKKNKQRIKQEFDLWIKELKKLDEKRIFWMKKKPLLLFCFFYHHYGSFGFVGRQKKPNQTKPEKSSLVLTISTHTKILSEFAFFFRLVWLQHPLGTTGIPTTTTTKTTTIMIIDDYDDHYHHWKYSLHINICHLKKDPGSLSFFYVS